MNTENIKKTICTAMAAIMAICMTSCGEVNNSPAAGGEETTAASERVTTITEKRPEPDDTVLSSDAQPDVPDETNPGDVQIDVSYAPAVFDKYPDADYIEQIADGRYIILDRPKSKHEAEVEIYDSDSDTVVNSFKVNTYDELFITPTIFYGKGFGFVCEAQDKSLRDPDAEWTYEEAKKTFYLDALYYDIDGELVNEFKKFGADDYSCSYTFAPDGSAFYVAQDDRQQCNCGYDFNPDFTTKIYKIGSDGTEEVIKEFDHHTTLYIQGMTNDERLSVIYTYNPNDITVYDHDEYEMHMGEYKKDEEYGLGFVSLEEGSAPEVTKAYTLDTYYDFTFVNDETFTLIDNDVLIRVFPDGEGGYKEERFEDSVGLEGYFTDLYFSADGKYAVYPTYTEDFADTTVNVVYFDENKPVKIFEKYYEGKKIEFDPKYFLTAFDPKSGEICARYSSEKEGLKGEIFRENIY